MLGTNQPVGRLGDLRGRIAVENADTGQLATDLIGALFELAIYRREPGGCCCGVPLAAITSASDDLVLTGGILAFRFPVAGLPWCAGPHELVLSVALDGRTSELLREPFTVA